MKEVAIVGAGDLGGALAHVLARRDAARSIRLIDERAQPAAGKALDIAQAAPIEGFAAQLSAASDWATAAGADVIVVADRFGGGEWSGDDGLRLVRDLTRSAPAAVIVCAGASQRELIDGAVRELPVDRRRLVGSAPEALAAGARALVALALNGSARDVSLSVLGVPPAHAVVPWQDATVAGFALTRLVDEAARRRIAARVPALWPPGAYALATAAALTIDAIAWRTRRLVSCFVGPDTSAGLQSKTAAMPVRLGPAGVVEVVAPSLSVVERIALENAVQL
jgi:malate dehydrogenase